MEVTCDTLSVSFASPPTKVYNRFNDDLFTYNYFLLHATLKYTGHERTKQKS